MNREQMEAHVKDWLEAEQRAIAARLMEEGAFNRALLASEGKSAEQHKADAEIKSEEHRLTAALAKSNATAKRMMCDYLISAARSQPVEVP